MKTQSALPAILLATSAGAGGTIGVAVVARANADGYTILVHSSSYTVTPTTYPNTPYDTLRDLQTTLEAGVPNSDYHFWVGVVVPTKTPAGVITKLHQNTVKTLQTPDITERMAKLGAEQMIMAPREFDAHIKKEIAINAALVKAAKINVN